MRPILDIPYSPGAYRPIDLTGLSDAGCREALAGYWDMPGVRVAYGGYMERRGLYDGFSHFQPAPGQERNIHLGLDLWAPAGTPVLVPEAATVHSWGHRKAPGDYGPVILLRHESAQGPLYTLYGHLSPESLEGLVPGKVLPQGALLATLGQESVNGGYAPHLHFQLIRDPGDYRGDYPGVCSLQEVDFYRENCPDPLPFLGW